jgi:hypothetical protein
MVKMARYHSDGTLDWALADGIEDGFWANFTHRCAGIAHTQGGGSYFACRRDVSSFWDSTMEFGVGQEDELIVEGTDGFEVLIGHYGAGGSLGWIANQGGVNTDGATGVTELDEDTIAFTGYHGHEALFGGGDSEALLETDTYAQTRAFVAEYDADGELIWATSAGGGYETVATAIARSTDGCILMAGYFNGTAVFGEGEPHETTLDSAGNFDVFVAKYAP